MTQSDEARARETLSAFELDLGWIDSSDRLWDDGEREKLLATLTAAFAEVRRQTVEACAAAVEPSKSLAVGYGSLRREIAASIRSLAPEPPDQPGGSGEP